MIEFIKGELDTLTPTSAVIDQQGIGYFINISLNTFSDIQPLKSCKLYIYEAIREDAIQLFGFSKQEERAVFLLLIGVSGVGANTARMILSSLTVEELGQCIAGNNVDILKSVKGIGLKTAQRILIDLKDKFAKSDSLYAGSVPGSGANEQIRYEALAALQMLGFSTSLSQKAVNKIMSEFPGKPVEQVVKAALKLL
jgi:holliday junction DNA helicase RuvA